MADPRNAVNFEEIKPVYVTYLIDDDTITYSATETNGSAQVDLAVTLVDDDTVGLTTDAAAVEGKLIKVEADGKAVVQVAGYMTLPSGDSASLTNGKKIVGDLDTAAKGYIREVNTGQAAELGVARGRIINNSDTAAVVVIL